LVGAILSQTAQIAAYLQFDYICFMNTMQIEILNPKAGKLLKDLADLKLIAIRNTQDDGLLSIVKKLRAKAKGDRPSLEEITREVEAVRAERYAKKKG
jgi:hypothetical protein